MFMWGVFWFTAAFVAAIVGAQAATAVLAYQIAAYVFALLALYYAMLGLIEQPKMLRARIRRFDQMIRRS